MSETIHRLKITLRSVKPPIWRRIEVDSDVTLGDLSDLLEAAMGRMGGHLHAFEAGGVTYEPPDPDGFGPRTKDENRHKLLKVLGATGAKLRWDYDFDPVAFDPEQATANMRAPRPLGDDWW